MTSFTFCSGTSFTLRRERSERGRGIKDGLEDGGRRPTTGAICGGGEPAGEAFAAALPGVRDFAAHGICLVGTLSPAWIGWDGGTESAATLESGAHGKGTRTAGDSVAPALPRLGSAQAAGAAEPAGLGVARQHHPPDFAAAWPGAGRGPARSCGAALCERAAQ